MIHLVEMIRKRLHGRSIAPMLLLAAALGLVVGLTLVLAP